MPAWMEAGEQGDLSGGGGRGGQREQSEMRGDFGYWDYDKKSGRASPEERECWSVHAYTGELVQTLTGRFGIQDGGGGMGELEKGRGRLWKTFRDTG